MSTTSPDIPTAREQSLRVRLIPYLDRYGVWLLVLLMVVIMAILQPDVFFSWRNLTNIGRQNVMNALLALGMFVVIVTAGIDLSVGSTLALGMMALAVTVIRDKAPWYLGIGLPLLMGLLVGLVNGLTLTKLRLPHPFIATLGTQFIVRGLTNIISGGVPFSGLPEEVRLLGARDFYTSPLLGEGRDFPIAVVVVLVCYGLMWLFLEHTRTGRHIYAIGGNPQAARVSGINVDGTLTLVYTLCGLFAGVAALMLAGRTNSGFPNAGLGSELDAISAVIIGGASFFGGRGSVAGTLAGVLVIGLLRNALNLLGVQVFWQQVLIGVVIIVAVWLDVLRRKAGSAGG